MTVPTITKKPGQTGFDNELLAFAKAIALYSGEINELIVMTAFGISYVWVDDVDKSGQTGMSTGEQGLQKDNSVVYRYIDSEWVDFYDLNIIFSQLAITKRLKTLTIAGAI